jgi:hypothetical protein
MSCLSLRQFLHCRNDPFCRRLLNRYSKRLLLHVYRESYRNKHQSASSLRISPLRQLLSESAMSNSRQPVVPVKNDAVHFHIRIAYTGTYSCFQIKPGGHDLTLIEDWGLLTIIDFRGLFLTVPADRRRLHACYSC